MNITINIHWSGADPGFFGWGGQGHKLSNGEAWGLGCLLVGEWVRAILDEFSEGINEDFVLRKK